MRVKILQYSSGIGVVDEPVIFFLGFELVLPLEDLLYYETGSPIILQLIEDRPPGSKLGYPEFVISTLRATHEMHPALSCVHFMPPFSGTCSTYLS